MSEEAVTLTCSDCGSLFLSTQKQKRLCPECDKKHRIEQVNRWKQKQGKAAKMTDGSLYEVDARAKAEGLSYGHYLQKYGYKD